MEGETSQRKQSPSKGLLQTESLYQYVLVTSVFPREPQPLKELRNLTATHPRPLMATSPDTAQLISLLLKLINAKKTIEVGVFTGYSLLLTALSIPHDGKITAIDMDRESYEIGLPVIRKAGVEHKVDFVESEALPALDKLLVHEGNEGSYDFAYVDADKENYANYHEKLMKLVRVGGIIAYDNTLWGGTVAMPADSSTVLGAHYPGVREFTIQFNKSLSADPRLDISLIPLGDGITICRRIS
ncbi:Probable caffeoyl-CoA O-methyltransferase At4g26220 [Linum grandiflorum]